MKRKMYLWLISSTNNVGHDYYDSAVVVASTRDIARTVHPRIGVMANTPEDDRRRLMDWVMPELVIVECVGEAHAKYKLEGEIICASFNAG